MFINNFLENSWRKAKQRRRTQPWPQRDTKKLENLLKSHFFYIYPSIKTLILRYFTVHETF